MSLTEQPNLKPCPFCGSTDVSLKSCKYDDASLYVSGERYHYVECMDCDSQTGQCFDEDAPHFGEFKDGKEMAIFKWNMRK